jgi:hypothetical protein
MHIWIIKEKKRKKKKQRRYSSTILTELLWGWAGSSSLPFSSLSVTVQEDCFSFTVVTASQPTPGGCYYYSPIRAVEGLIPMVTWPLSVFLPMLGTWGSRQHLNPGCLTGPVWLCDIHCSSRRSRPGPLGRALSLRIFPFWLQSQFLHSFIWPPKSDLPVSFKNEYFVQQVTGSCGRWAAMIRSGVHLLTCSPVPVVEVG